MNNKGFTLVELLAVLAILGVIAIIAIPTISTTLNKEDKLDLKRRKEIILSETEIKIDKINDLLNNNECCDVASLVSGKIITASQAKDKNKNVIEGGVKYDANHELVYDDLCTTKCNT